MTSSICNICIVITGASKGFGQAIVYSFTDYIINSNNSNKNNNNNNEKQQQQQQQQQQVIQPYYYLIGRSMDGLDETKHEIQTKFQNYYQQLNTVSNNTVNNNTNIHCYQMDLNKLHTIDNITNTIMNDIDNDISNSSYSSNTDITNTTTNTKSNTTRIVFINNAGSLGYVGLTINSPSIIDMTNTIQSNITSSLWLSTRFLQKYSTNTTNSNVTNKSNIVSLDIINISSLTAIQGFPTMSIYSTTKAACDMYHKCIAFELNQSSSNNSNSTTNNTSNTTNTNTTILNYAPGPLETQMSQSLRINPLLHDSISNPYQQPLLDPYDSATKLITLVTSIWKYNKNTSTNNTSANPKPTNETSITDEAESKSKSESQSDDPYYTIVSKFTNGDHIDYYDLP